MSDVTQKGASSCFVDIMTLGQFSHPAENYPKPTKDGRWIIGHDPDWEPIIIDDIETLDPLTRESLLYQQQDADLKLFSDANSKAENCETVSDVKLTSNTTVDTVSDSLENVAIPLPFYELNNQGASTATTATAGGTIIPIGEWDTPEPEPTKQGLVGLTNLGNTCFINSGLQCLLNNSRLVKFVLEDYQNPTENRETLCDKFVDLVKEAWSTERKKASISCKKFKEILGQRFEQFKDFRQHDCQEFLALLLSALHDELREETHVKTSVDDNPVSSPKSNASSPSSASSSSSLDIHSNEDEIRRQPIPEGIQSFNNIIPLLVKETKTLNTNVSKIDDDKNNKLSFNSFKYPRTRRKENVVHDNMLDNLRGGGGSLVEETVKGSKRLKQTNVTKDVLMDEESSTAKNCVSKRQKTVAETEAGDDEEEQDQGDGINEWRQYLVFNKSSVIVDTFQGQFKSIITCFGCKGKSVTYEPFMYLALPLPHALEKQLIVTLVNSSNYTYGSREVEGGKPMRYFVKVHKYDQVSKIADVLNSLLIADGVLASGEALKMCLAEVQDNCVYKTLENHSLVRDIDDKKSLYAFVMSTCPKSKETNEKPVEFQEPFIGPILMVQNCVICLEEKSATDLLIHDNQCVCKLCMPCLEKLIEHHTKENNCVTCPSCFIAVTKENFYALDSDAKESTTSVRSFTLPLLYRLEQFNGGLNKYKLVSHPLMLELQNVGGAQLYEMVERLVPYPCPYSLHFVDRTGQQCSRCYWSTLCTGCEISRLGEIKLNYDDCIAVQFDSTFSSENFPQDIFVDHKSVADAGPCLSKEPQNLKLQDCLSAFSETELLDEDNPWFCTTCDSSQRARKSLSIWRSPDTLMVYLKRFVFHQMQSVKVDEPVSFPIDALDMSPFVKGSASEGEMIYELQSLVCHSGGVNSGHYTAFSRHCTTGEWYYFNDDTVTRQDPNPCDDRAYILFYQRPKGNYAVKPIEKNLSSVANQDCESMTVNGEGDKTEIPMNCD